MGDTAALVREPAEPGGSDGVTEGVAIALSGGGYRAMLFHAGALWRLGELGFFSGELHRFDPVTGQEVPVGRLERISSVSGGSIVSAVLGLNFNTLSGLSGAAFVDRYRALVIGPVRELAGTTLAGTSAAGAWAVIKDVLMPGRVNAHVASAYDRILYKGATLQDLPDRVRFVINASNLQSGVLWRFSKPYCWDWKVGQVANPRVRLADAVGASSAFPPVLAPAVLDFKESAYTPGSGDGLQRPPFTTTPTLADGGVYDNLGLETCFKSFRTLLVSNAGKPFEAKPEIKANWVSIGARCLDVMDNQVLAQRKRQLLGALTGGQRFGAFWDIQQDIVKHACVGALPCPAERTRELAAVGTDLASKPAVLQERLINWGYANADAAVRAWFDRTLPVPAAFPYPSACV